MYTKYRNKLNATINVCNDNTRDTIRTMYRHPAKIIAYLILTGVWEKGKNNRIIAKRILYY